MVGLMVYNVTFNNISVI